MRGIGVASLFIMVAGLAAAPVGAQTAPVVTVDDFQAIAEVGIGAAIVSATGNTSRVDPAFGAAVSAALYPTEVVGIAGELNVFGSGSRSAGADRIGDGRSALAGVKVRTRLLRSGSTAWRFFGQVLGGPQWTDSAPTRTVLQPGAGADDYLPNGVVVHVEYDYAVVAFGRGGASTGRFLVGLGCQLGSR